MSSRFSVVLSLLSFALLSTVLFDVSSVSAATPYDNLLHVTDKILIRDSNGNENDITTTYMGAVLSYLNDNPTDTHAQNLYSKLQSNTASGVGWSMIGYRDGVADTAMQRLVGSLIFTTLMLPVHSLMALTAIHLV